VAGAFALVGGISAWAWVHLTWTVGVRLKQRLRRRERLTI
jgi:hypothetical protein